VQDRTKLTMMD